MIVFVDLIKNLEKKSILKHIANPLNHLKNARRRYKFYIQQLHTDVILAHQQKHIYTSEILTVVIKVRRHEFRGGTNF